MTYEQALTYIHSFDWRGSRPGLSRTLELCRRLGNPEKSLRFVHVAGTNGKGSFCKMLSEILTAAGYKTGLFVSPYVTRFNERIQVDGSEIPDKELAWATSLVKDAADAMEDGPTEFELITAIGFLYFKKMNCDVVVLECGMGGRLDSTNVIVDPLLSVITGISLDHTKILGDTIEKIAAEKAGIIKAGRPCLYGGEDPAAKEVIKTTASEKQAPFFCVDYSRLSVKTMALGGTTFDFAPLQNLRLSLLGSYQPENAARVLTAVEILQNEGMNISEEAIRKGLSSAVWPARFEKLLSDPLVFYDGGHNPEGIAAATESIRTYFPGQKVNLLMGVMADKDYSEMCKTLSPLANKVFTVTPSNPRSLSAEDLAKLFPNGQAFQTVKDGLFTALTESKQEGIPLVCLGSLYLYPEVRKALSEIL
ncbi:MAG: bifunctional folylpolyglutamate synthase/dihydrofolate synthase [Clostridia bacterium]|nr:bifunctional folylpolyglutamate synthase/dihydrofolate synthase [Clostridia bacterium]